MEETKRQSQPSLKPDLATAVLAGLRVLGEQSERALLYHLEHSYRISIKPGTPVSMEKLEQALTELLGSGASVVIGLIHAEIRHSYKDAILP